MQFCLLILGSPHSSNACHTALRFAKATIERGHSVYRVFLLHDGVHLANALNTAPQGTQDINHEWASFITEYNIDAVSCIASSLQAGILNASESERYDKHSHNLHPAYELSGLGQLADAMLHVDRLITFKGDA